MSSKEKFSAALGTFMMVAAIAVGVFHPGPGAAAGAIGLGFFALLLIFTALVD